MLLIVFVEIDSSLIVSKLYDNSSFGQRRFHRMTLCQMSGDSGVQTIQLHFGVCDTKKISSVYFLM